MRMVGFALILALGVLVLWGSSDLPMRGDATGPAPTHVAAYYAENARSDSRTPNIVTAVLADYRGFDTFGEAVVVVSAALACLLILLRRREDDEEGEEAEGGTG